MAGFITDDGYGAIPYGKQLLIIYNNEQLENVKTKKLAEQFINQHRASSNSVTPKPQTTQKTARVRKTKN